jgi:hypothetical protein
MVAVDEERPRLKVSKLLECESQRSDMRILNIQTKANSAEINKNAGSLGYKGMGSQDLLQRIVKMN